MDTMGNLKMKDKMLFKIFYLRCRQYVQKEREDPGTSYYISTSYTDHATDYPAHRQKCHQKLWVKLPINYNVRHPPNEILPP